MRLIEKVYGTSTRLALVNPPQKHLVTPYVYPPVGLGYLAAVVARDCDWVECEILDLAGEHPDNVVDRLGLYDVVGYTSPTPYWNDTLALAARVRGPLQIVGGAHVTIAREQNRLFDTTFFGPAEETLPQYLRDLREGIQKPLYEGTLGDLNEIPFPLCSLGKKLNYGGAAKTAVVFTSRGCTHQCAFCAARSVYPRIALRTIENVVAELTQLQGSGITEVRFMDDAFTMMRDRTFSLCKAMEPLGLRWACMVRADQVDSELLSAMKAAGCSEIALGVESFDQAVLDALRKDTTVERNVQAIEVGAGEGLRAHLFLMMSTPGETCPKTADLNIAGLEKIKDKFARMLFSTFMPHLGTPVHDDPALFGVRIVDYDFSRYNQHPYVRGKHGPRATPCWSPIRIDGMSERQQMRNLRRVRDYACSLPQVNRGIF